MYKTADLSAVFGLYRQNETSVTDSDIALLQILLCGLVLYHFVESFAELHTCAVYFSAYRSQFRTCSVCYLVLGDYRTLKLFKQPVIRLQS